MIIDPRNVLSLILLALLSCDVQGVLLPKLPGKYKVGTTALELINSGISPPHDLMVSIFYPTKDCNYALAPYFTPIVASYENAQYGLPNGTAESIITQAYLHAPLYQRSFPVLLFSTGYGVPRIIYTAIASALASRGYVVLTIDHPIDSSVIEYPDGRYIIQNPPTINRTEETVPIVASRVTDVRFVLNQLSNSSFVSQIPGYRHAGAIDISRVGVLGHSLGGATAGSAMLVDSRFACGANLDGSMSGDVITAGLDKPFLLMSSSVHNRTNDKTWQQFWPNLRGFKRDLSVDGTQHLSYSDYLVISNLLGSLVPAEIVALLGTIKGDRMLDLEEAYLGAFFDMCLKKKKEKLLERESRKWPEVHFNW